MESERAEATESGETGGTGEPFLIRRAELAAIESLLRHEKDQMNPIMRALLIRIRDAARDGRISVVA